MQLGELRVDDDPAAWERCGFTVNADDRIDIGGVSVVLRRRAEGPPVKARGDGIAGWTFFSPTATVAGQTGSIGGIPTRVARQGGSDAPGRAQPAAHPNAATRLDHVVVFTTNLSETTREVAELLGLAPRKPAQLVGGRMMLFFKAGPVIIEVVAPCTSDDSPAPPNRRSPAEFFKRSITAFVGSARARLWGLTVATADIHRAYNQVAPFCGTLRASFQDDKRLIFTARSADLGISPALAFIQPSTKKKSRGRAKL
ncbi:hypothetical protein DIPPA_29825 [Diplonema papillatum]|nr:hypothetical protein DIPPA_29825 [Diplonema papillatum]